MIIHGDAKDKLKEIESESIDVIVTDPPYGLRFMGKNWDKSVPSTDIWSECVRVLKSGAFAFIMCTPRMDCLTEMGNRLKEAGFETGFTPIFWTYAEGFPKAANISKIIDKRMGTERKIARKLEKERKRLDVYETKSATDKAIQMDGSYAGFQPKPAVEIIIVAMKPLSEKTYVDQALKNGKGITWLDDCRIPYKSDNDIKKVESGQINKHKGMINVYKKTSFNESKTQFDPNPTSQDGRFPANLLISDDILNDKKYHPSGDLTGQKGTQGNVYGTYDRSSPQYLIGNSVDSFSRYFDLDAWWKMKKFTLPKTIRKLLPFLIVPKPSKEEKNKGIKHFTKQIGHNRFDRCLKCGKYIFQNKDRPSACQCEHPIRQHNIIKGNFHPTVKPIQLGCYLIEMGSRPNDTVLDPFCGSGSFLISAKLQGRYYIGIEINEEYYTLAKARVNNYLFQEKLK